MLRIALISMFSLLSLAPARAESVGTYSKCSKLGANVGACNRCLRTTQFFNFDTAHKKWVCGNTNGRKESRPTSKPTKASVTKQPVRPLEKR